MLTENTLRRMETRLEELAELFLDQSEPEGWRDLTTKDTRGDTYWLKKNAAQTLGIMVRIQSLLNAHMQRGGAPVNPEDQDDKIDSTDALVRQAEADATAVIDRVRIKRK